MKLFALLGALALACLCLIITPFAAAYAQAVAVATPDTTISALPWIKVIEPYLLTAFSVIVTAIIGWVAALIQRSTGITIEQKYRDSLHSALVTGISAGLTKLDARAADVSIDTKSQLITDAIRWAQKSVPDAIKALGASPDDLAKLAAAKLNLLIEAPSAATSAPLSGKAAT